MKWKFVVFPVLLTVALALSAFQGGTPVPTASLQATGSPAASTTLPGSAATSVAATGARVVGVEDILGQELENEAGTGVGRVENLIIDAGNGCVVYTVVGFSRLFGLGERLVPVPAELVSAGSAQNNFVVNVATELLEGAPSFNRYNWPDTTAAGWDQPVQRYWASMLAAITVPACAPAAPGSTPTGTATAAARGAGATAAPDRLGTPTRMAATPMTATRGVHVRVTRLGAYPVLAQDNIAVGSVADLLIDLDSRQVLYLGLMPNTALAAGATRTATRPVASPTVAGTAGTATRLAVTAAPGNAPASASGLVAVPWSALRVDVQQSRITLRVSRELLLTAPRITMQNWSALGSNGRSAEVSSFWSAAGFAVAALGQSPMATVTAPALAGATAMPSPSAGGTAVATLTGTTPVATVRPTAVATRAATSLATGAATRAATGLATAVAGTALASPTVATGGRTVVTPAAVVPSTGLIVRANSLIGYTVRNPAGETLGSLVDMLVDMGELTARAGAAGTTGPAATVRAAGTVGPVSSPSPLATGARGAGPIATAATAPSGSAATPAGTNAILLPAVTAGTTSISGRLVYGVVAFGGFLGIGEQRVAVPWHLMSLDVGGRAFIINADRPTLTGAPGFDAANLPANTGDPNWDINIRAYWQAQTGAMGAGGSRGAGATASPAPTRTVTATVTTLAPSAAASPAATQAITVTRVATAAAVSAAPAITGTASATAWPVTGAVMRVSRIMNAGVRDSGGESVGGVADLLIDLGSMTSAAALPALTSPISTVGVAGTPAAGATAARGAGVVTAGPSPVAPTALPTATSATATPATTTVAVTAGTPSRVIYAVVGYGGFLGIGEQRVLVPWSLFSADTQGNLALRVAADVVRNAPGFDTNALPRDTADPAWDSQIRSYWQAQGAGGR